MTQKNICDIAGEPVNDDVIETNQHQIKVPYSHFERRGIKELDHQLGMNYKLFYKGTDRYLVQVHRTLGKPNMYSIEWSYSVLPNRG